LGISTLLAVTGLHLLALDRKAKLPRKALLAVNCMMGMVLVQVSLGIATLVSYVPVPLAASHQAGAMSLLSISLWMLHEVKRLPR